ncbi:sigma 54-interacting transcriptional regulator [Hymenobacter negativus]|uniref:Sigma 54-interacting transcriptional regulator n=1 Tax=Hymenobacter negativus TaxID=2795026 RepID=A0ABS3QKH4_9BACT|nr:sigma 54-interacting transcriptional regulator [Hymenobacter negativus]MBO2011586.1 sigma 54-interacting transcriptional regulator [Hymenobacter negativus]
MLPTSALSALPSLLIVEDEFVIANGLRRILEKEGYQVTGIAVSVAKAQTLVAEQRPDIVLLDIFLKGEETGIDLAHWLKEQDIPFVFLSANLTDSVLEEAKVTEPYGFLNKPFRERDVLSTLEIARYRHAHSAEAKLRQQQSIQMAVNNAIVTLHDRDELCQAIAVQLNKVVPFSMFSLRLALPEEAAFYWVTLQQTAGGDFEPVQIPVQVRREAIQEFQRKLADSLAGAPPEEAGLFTGAAFEALCARYTPARSSRSDFGMQALALFPVALKQRNSSTTIQLACTEPNGFTPKDYAAVELLIPQVALAVDNLLASEEIEARRQLKATELGVVRAFQNGKDLAETTRQVAAAIHELLPIDVLCIYWPDQAPELIMSTATVEWQTGLFETPPTERIVPPAEVVESATWQQAWATLPAELSSLGLFVGEEYEQMQARNAAIQFSANVLATKSLICVPITLKNNSVASLLVASKTAFAFTAHDMRTMQSLGEQVALGLENLLAFERIQLLSEQLERENRYLVEEIKISQTFGEIVGTSPAMLNIFNSIGQVAPTDYTVLVLGETGTGKELIARAVHNVSKRKDRTMIKVNCAALPAQLIESELFGHERGSYTGATEQRIGKFELAHKSTIFLDEIGELPLELQAKLLRVLQEGEIERLGGKGIINVDVRVIAATNRNLLQEVAAGRFRSDLYYRLNVFPVLVPPLRERQDDILPLAMHFLQKIGKKMGKPLTGLSQSTLHQLRQYPWPGNIREMEHVLERAAILSRTATVELAEPLQMHPAPPAPAAQAPAARLAQPLDEAMRETILAALAQTHYRIRGAGGAAELLDIKPTTLEARMKKLRIGPNS